MPQWDLHTDPQFPKWTKADLELHNEGIFAMLVWYLSVSPLELPKWSAQRCSLGATLEMRVSTLCTENLGASGKQWQAEKTSVPFGSNLSGTNSNPKLLRETALIRTLNQYRH